MAAVPPPVQSAPAAKYDAFVAAQLARAMRRIRLLDLGSALLGLVGATALYALAIILLDAWLGLPSLARGLLLVAYVLGLVASVGFVLVRLFYQRINPRYAALQVERVVPGARNGLVNWVDLHEQELPAAIRQAVTQRAAKEAAQADLDQAVSSRRTLVLGSGSGLLLGGLVVTLLILGPPRFFSFLQRALFPFGSGAVQHNTQLRLLEPFGGDVAIPVDRPVRFTAEVTGRIPEPGKPDVPRLLYRFRPEEPYEERPLDQESATEWGTVLSAAQIQGNGFWYKLAAGDSETPEYHVTVRARPLIESREVTYHYRPYRALPDRAVKDPPLVEGLRGTRVTLVARASQPARTVDNPTLHRPVKGELRLQLGGEVQTIYAEPDADPRTLRFELVLDQDGKQHVQSGKYQVRYTSTDGDLSASEQQFDFAVERDEPPAVDLQKADKDRVPANGFLELQGDVHDDVGIKDVRLQLQLVAGPRLGALPYRPERNFQFADGEYPHDLGYRDLVQLTKVKDAGGQSFELKPGMILEYWLEAKDGCDYPEPLQGQVGASRHFRVTIDEAAKDAKPIEKERKKAEERKQAHEENQDQQLQNEEQQRGEQKKQDAAGGQANKNEAGANGQGQGSSPSQPEKQNGQGTEKQNDKQNQGGGPNSQQGEGSSKSGTDAQNGKPDSADQERERIREKAQQALARKDRGEGKGGSESQSEGSAKDQGDPGPQPDKGNSKGNGTRQPQPDAGQAKQGTGAQGAKQDASAAKDAGSQAGQEKAGAAKEQQPERQSGQARDEGKPETNAAQQNEAKAGGQPGESKDAGQAKAPQNTSSGNPADASSAKQGAPQSSSPDPNKGDSVCKGNPGASSSESKPGAKNGDPAGGASSAKDAGGQQGHPEAKGTARSEGTAQGNSSDPATAKPEGAQGSSTGTKTAEQMAEEARRDPAKWKQVRDALEKQSQEATDPREREEARKALEEMKKLEPSGSPTNSQSPQTNQTTASQNKPDGQSPKTPGSQNAEAGNAPGSQPPQPSKQGTPGAPGNGNEGTPNNANPAPPESLPDPTRPKIDYHQRPGDLQLIDNVAKQLTPEELKAAGISPAEWEWFRKEAAKAAAARAHDKVIGDPTAPLPAAGALPDLGVRRTADPNKKTGDATQGGRGQAPPGIWSQGEKEYARERARAAEEWQKK